jgi:hypothetical protein
VPTAATGLGKIGATASPNATKAAALQQRLSVHARRWPQITEIKARWRAGYAYIEAVINGEDEGELQLCRLKDTGHPQMWRFALFTYSNEHYEDNILPTGLPFGTPEDALDCACGLYLGDPPA